MGRIGTFFVLLTVFAAVVLSSAVTEAAGAAEKVVVKYRLTKQKTLHVKTEKAAHSYDLSLKKLGCESKLGKHSGHFDLTYKCPQWRQAGFDDHETAHKWQAWLKKLGFETAHKH